MALVDFIKLDVEGAELSALKGAPHLLQHSPRPVLLVEVYNVRTEPWGYKAREIVQFMDHSGYRWFRLRGWFSAQRRSRSGCVRRQLVVIPEERATEVLQSIQHGVPND
jgi:hypothetical protein